MSDPKTDAEIVEEARAYRENLVKHGFYKPDLWWARLLAIVENRDTQIARMRFQAQSFRWFFGVRSKR